MQSLAAGAADDGADVVHHDARDRLGPLQDDMHGDDAAERRADDDDTIEVFVIEQVEHVVPVCEVSVVLPVGVVLGLAVTPPVHAQHPARPG